MSSKKGQPTIDPYDALGIEPNATDAEITKAYRKLALKLHPDKQKRDISPEEAEAIAKRFHDIKEARSFLLDAEHAEDRRAFDAKRESEKLRKQADELREKNMSIRRKRMRDELKEKEARARQSSKKKVEKNDKELVDQLRRDGKELREKYAERDIEKELARELKREREARAEALEERQVRLKWDRKKIKISPSEHSIASLLSKFGHVEEVEMLGSKGNQALVTFADPSSCRPCVDAYATSKEMRAKFIGKRKEREEERERDADNDIPATTNKRREGESLEDRRLRQAAEREELLRQMEAEDEEETGRVKHSSNKFSTRSPAHNETKTRTSKPFPIPFPDSSELSNLSPLQKLEKMEKKILGPLISPEQLQSIQVTR